MMTQDVMTQKVQASNVKQSCLQHAAVAASHSSNFVEFSWWRHPMDTFSALLAICAGINRTPVNFPHKGQWFGALMFSLICVWIYGRLNNHEAGDLRRYRTHYEVIAMIWLCSSGIRANVQLHDQAQPFYSSIRSLSKLKSLSLK